MANIIKPKRSSTASAVPTTSNLADGEIAFNTTDKKIYMRVGAAIVDMSSSYTPPPYLNSWININPATKADLASPPLTGTPTAPTATAGTNTNQIATTAFTTGAIAAVVVDSIADADTTHAPSRNAVFDALSLKAPLTGTGASGTWPISISGSAATLTTARTLTIGATGKTFNGSANVAWSLAEIGALPTAGGTATGDVTISRGATAGGLFLDTDAAVSADLRFQTAGSLRWVVRKSSDSEAGSNAGSNLQVNRYSDAGAFAATALTINRASGEVSLPGNLKLTGTGQRFQGDFSSGTVSDRLLLQTSTANDNTNVGAIPNGTGTIALYSVWDNADTTNASTFQFRIEAGGPCILGSSAQGTGTVRDISFQFAGVEKARLTTTGVLSLAESGNEFHRAAANSTTLTRQPRVFVQSGDPGAAASDGDLWIW